MSDIYLTREEWNQLVSENKIEAVPNQEKGFLMYGQVVDVLVNYNKKKYRASAWIDSENKITLSEI